MKKCVFAFLMLFTIVASQAQNDSIKSNNFGKNEVKLNALFLILGAFDASYERNFSESSSAGISLFIPFGYNNVDTNINYYVSPYYRIFFGKKYAAGFFLEGFGMLNSINEDYYVNHEYYLEIKENAITDFALGFGLGGKWMTAGGFVFEVNGGLGRNLFNSNSKDSAILVGKLGFNVGYRF